MKLSTVWRGHSTRLSLPAGTARKAKENLPRGRRNRLITLPAKRNRAFPTGNALLYISLSSVAFGRVRPDGRTLFFIGRIKKNSHQIQLHYIFFAHLFFFWHPLWYIQNARPRLPHFRQYQIHTHMLDHMHGQYKSSMK